MTRCSIINCSNTTNVVGAVNRGISFHRFPNDPHIKNKWIEATGRIKWFPTKNSRICSLHFHEDTFTGPAKYRRVISTAYPTIDVVIMSNDEKIKDESSSEEDSKSNTPGKRKFEMDINEQSTSDEIPIDTPKKEKILNQLNNARQVIKQKDKEIKRLKELNRRKAKKILTLMALLGRLKKNTLNNDELAETLKTTDVSTEELYIKEEDSTEEKDDKGSVTTCKYSPPEGGGA